MSPLLLAWAVLGLVLAASLLLYTLLSLGQAWYRHKLSTSGVRIQGDSAGSPGPLLTGSHLSCLCNSAQRSSVLSTETRRLPPSHAQKRKNIPQPGMPSIPEVAQSINFIIYCDLVKVLQLSMSKSMSQFLNWASFFSFINAESCLKKLSDEWSK